MDSVTETRDHTDSEEDISHGVSLARCLLTLFSAESDSFSTLQQDYLKSHDSKTNGTESSSTSLRTTSKRVLRRERRLLAQKQRNDSQMIFEACNPHTDDSDDGFSLKTDAEQDPDHHVHHIPTTVPSRSRHTRKKTPSTHQNQMAVASSSFKQTLPGHLQHLAQAHVMPRPAHPVQLAPPPCKKVSVPTDDPHKQYYRNREAARRAQLSRREGTSAGMGMAGITVVPNAASLQSPFTQHVRNGEMPMFTAPSPRLLPASLPSYGGSRPPRSNSAHIHICYDIYHIQQGLKMGRNAMPVQAMSGMSQICGPGPLPEGVGLQTMNSVALMMRNDADAAALSAGRFPSTSIAPFLNEAAPRTE